MAGRPARRGSHAPTLSEAGGIFSDPRPGPGLGVRARHVGSRGSGGRGRARASARGAGAARGCRALWEPRASAQGQGAAQAGGRLTAKGGTCSSHLERARLRFGGLASPAWLVEINRASGPNQLDLKLRTCQRQCVMFSAWRTTVTQSLLRALLMN